MKFAWLILALLGLTAPAARADDVPELKALEARYDQAKLVTDESLRQKYILELAMLRFHLSHSESLAWEQVEAEMAKHPAPADSDSAAFNKLRIGIWYSPRHSYGYKSDGTWVMDPDDKDSTLNTHGTWSIKGNQYTDGAAVSDEAPTKYTIILLTKDNFIFTNPCENGPCVYFERRTEEGGLPIMRDDPAPPFPSPQPTAGK